MAGEGQLYTIRSLRMFAFSLALFLVGGMVFAMSFFVFAVSNIWGASIPGAVGLLIMFIAALLLSTS